MDKCIDCSNDVSRYGTKRCSTCYHKWRKGRGMPNGFGERLSKRRVGVSNPFFGKKHTLELKKLWSSQRCGVSNPSYGKRGSSCPTFGASNPNWRGGITKLIRQIRTCTKYGEWRMQVFSRDGFKCRICGRNKTYLEGHHNNVSLVELINIFNIKTIDEAISCDSLWDIDNGITTCSRCHCLIDPSRGRFGVL